MKITEIDDSTLISEVATLRQRCRDLETRFNMPSSSQLDFFDGLTGDDDHRDTELPVGNWQSVMFSRWFR